MAKQEPSEGAALSVSLKPKPRWILSMHPYLPIEKNTDGTGGGIQLRILGEDGWQFVDVIWGESTEIEIL